jgi:uncharacterized protein (TIGR03437 family)
MAKQIRWVVIAVLVGSCALLAQAPNEIMSVGYTVPAYPQVAPGQVITLFTSFLNVADAAAMQTPLPTSLSGLSVAVRVSGAHNTTGYPTSLPIFRIRSVTSCSFPDDQRLCPRTEITVQIPTEGVCVVIIGDPNCNSPSQVPPLLILNIRANAVSGPDMPLLGHVIAPHLLTFCDTIFGAPQANCYPLVAHADGTLVNAASPGKAGETIVVYATGLVNAAKTGYPATEHVEAPAGSGLLGFAYRTQPNVFTDIGWIEPAYAGTAPGYVGLGQINVVVPPTLPGMNQCLNLPGDAGFNTRLTPVGPGGPPIFICVAP